MKTMQVIVCLFLLCSEASAKNMTVQESDFGEKWPFTISEGVLNCSNNEVTFRSQGKVYAVNGTAVSAGYAPIDPIWEYNMVLIKELAEALDMTIEEVKVDTPLKVDIGPIIETGLALCE